MKVSVQDSATLAALRPLELAAYLRSTGWQHVSAAQDRWATWVKDSDFEIALPLASDLGDFVLRMADAVKVLAVVENRSELEIINDLQMTSADVLRSRITDAEAADGTIPIEEAARIVEQARDLVMAGACAAIERRAVFHARKPNQAVDYLKKVRMGQTERGSYVITVISRVAPILRVGEGERLFDLEQPYERQVMETLARALEATKKAASSAAATGDFQQFKESVNDGVSANLCDALRGMASGGEVDRKVEMSFTWSRSRPIDPKKFDKIVFSPDSMPVLEEAARLFRETSPREEFELKGPVVKLERAEGAEIGRVTVLGFVDGQARKILLDLYDRDYNIAIQAHKHEQTIFGLGSLIREGRSYSLKNPHALAIEPDEQV